MSKKGVKSEDESNPVEDKEVLAVEAKEALPEVQSSDNTFTSQQLDILNDVTMNITVEIGKAKIKISDLLHLKKGSIVELHQEANEPLQIYANDKPIAKGVIITANGKYCVKIV